MSRPYQQWLTSPTAQVPKRQDNERVTLDRGTYEQLSWQADAWRSVGHAIREHDPALMRLLNSPAVRDVLLAAWDDWSQRQDASANANAISASTTWSRVASPSWAGLQERRARRGALHDEFTERHGGEYAGGPVDWTTGRPLSGASRAA